MQRRFHYELAFEHYLRANGIAYVAVDEARRAIVGQSGLGRLDEQGDGRLKSFDFVVYSETGANLLVDVKGRKLTARRGSATSASSFQNWVTAEDVDHLGRWEAIFGQGFVGAFAFLFWCDAPPPDALFQEVFEHKGKWYAVLAVTLADYRARMKPRSRKWETVCLPSKTFQSLAVPLKEMLKAAAP